jgi:hypothetical protein
MVMNWVWQILNIPQKIFQNTMNLKTYNLTHWKSQKNKKQYIEFILLRIYKMICINLNRSTSFQLPSAGLVGLLLGMVSFLLRPPFKNWLTDPALSTTSRLISLIATVSSGHSLLRLTSETFSPPKLKLEIFSFGGFSKPFSRTNRNRRSACQHLVNLVL